MSAKVSPSEKVSVTKKTVFGAHQSEDSGVQLAALVGSKTIIGAVILGTSILPRYLAALVGGLILVSAYRNAVSFTFRNFFFPPKPKAMPAKEEQLSLINLDVNSIEPINFRVAPVIEGDFVVFLIGVRVNELSRGNDGQWVAKAFQNMLKELEERPELGCINVDSYAGTNPLSGPTTLSVQYWRSFELLTDYARGKNSQHYPAWMRIVKSARAGGLKAGIWHETYKVRAGEYEGIYVNTPPFGLAKAGLVPAVGRMTTSKGRAGETNGTDYLEGAEEAYVNLNKLDMKIEQKCPMTGAEEGACPVAH